MQTFDWIINTSTMKKVSCQSYYAYSTKISSKVLKILLLVVIIESDIYFFINTNDSPGGSTFIACILFSWSLRIACLRLISNKCLRSDCCLLSSDRKVASSLFALKKIPHSLDLIISNWECVIIPHDVFVSFFIRTKIFLHSYEYSFF